MPYNLDPIDEKDRLLARQIARELMSMISEEVGRSVLQKALWAIILFAIGGVTAYIKLK